MEKLTPEQLEEIKRSLRDIYDIYKSPYEEFYEDLNKLSIKVNNLPSFVENTNAEFEKLTGITAKDMPFLIVAVFLQGLRILLMERLKLKKNDKEAAKKTFGKKEEHSDKRKKRYYASIDEIVTNPVPFDAIQKESIVKVKYNPKISGFNHRFVALGHDPYLGLVIGTANILTKTITLSEGNFNVSSYHVHTGEGYNGKGFYPIDKLSAKANTTKIFLKIKERLSEEGKKGWFALGAAIIKEIIHLRSDLRTTYSLPIPIISASNSNIARILAMADIDYLAINNLENEILLAELINYIIRILHSICYNKKTDVSKELYKVRTLKIIMYSNEIATVSGIVRTLIKAFFGDLSEITKLDYGGTIVTFYHVFHDEITIAKIKHEYLLSKSINYLNK